MTAQHIRSVDSIEPLSLADALPAPILTVLDLHIGFAIQNTMVEVVKGVNFRVPAGKTVALVGESGSGKSVIAQAIMGILPKSGHVLRGAMQLAPTHTNTKTGKTPATSIDLATLPRTSKRYQKLRGQAMAMIFQEPMTALSPVHTIGDQISESLLIHHAISRRAALAAARAMLDLVGFRDSAGALNRYAFELSGGLRQRAMLAMALINKPALLIADEPTTALDVTIQAQVLHLMKQLQSEMGMAILLITHDLGVVANMADEVVVIYQGSIVESGTLHAVFEAPKHPYLQALMKAVPVFDMPPNARLAALRETKRDVHALFAHTLFTHAKALPAPQKLATASDAPQPPLLKVNNLCKDFTVKCASGLFGSRTRVSILQDVSFHIPRGGCFGLVGESGSGKSTIAKLIMRALAPSSGQIVFHDSVRGTVLDLATLNAEALRAFRPKMQMIFQDPVSALSPRMSVLDIIREPLQIHGVGTDKEQRVRVKDLMRAVGLDPRYINRYPHSFSGGQRQRIGIARALALNPELVICDEPVSALDVSVQAQILNLLRDLREALGLTYLFISHNLAVVDYMATHIGVLARGRLVEIAPRQDLFRAPAHPYTQALIKAVPYPDLSRPLDFGALVSTHKGTSASDPQNWPEIFQESEEAPLRHHEIAPAHFVLARDEYMASAGKSTFSSQAELALHDGF